MRRRRAVAALVAIVAIAAAALAAISLVGNDPGPGEADARRTVRRYLTAWEAGDVERMQRFVTSPAGELASTYLATFGGLSVAGARIEPGPVRVDGDRGRASFSARLQLAGLGPWQYRGHLPLEHDGTRWLVAWSPAALHPDLRPGLRLAASGVVPPRAPIVGSDGTPLDGQGLDLADVLGTVGGSGLQATFDDQLGGKPSGTVELRDASGQVEQTLRHFPGQAPMALSTTIDPAVQRAAQAPLADTTQPAALVAIGTDGAIHAVVSRPVGGFPRALLGKYPPGSTFKIVTTTAALDAGIPPQEVIDCPPQVTVDGKVFVNAEGGALGPIPLTTAFARSCNTAFVNLAGRLTDDQLLSAASTYGFDAEPALGVASFGGSFPPPSGAVEHAASALGQGRVEASPVQMASVAAAVAGGAWHPPHVVADGAAESRPLDSAVAASLQQMMGLVVTEGTGTAAALPGSPVHGKTGTAEFGTATPPQTHAWFVGFRDDLAFAVLVEDGGFGGDVAAPIAARFLAAVAG